MSRQEIPDDSELQSLAKELAKNVKSQKGKSGTPPPIQFQVCEFAP